MKIFSQNKVNASRLLNFVCFKIERKQKKRTSTHKLLRSPAVCAAVCVRWPDSDLSNEKVLKLADKQLIDRLIKRTRREFPFYIKLQWVESMSSWLAVLSGWPLLNQQCWTSETVSLHCTCGWNEMKSNAMKTATWSTKTSGNLLYVWAASV